MARANAIRGEIIMVHWTSLFYIAIVTFILGHFLNKHTTLPEIFYFYVVLIMLIPIITNLIVETSLELKKKF